MYFRALMATMKQQLLMLKWRSFSRGAAAGADAKRSIMWEEFEVRSCEQRAPATKIPEITMDVGKQRQMHVSSSFKKHKGTKLFFLGTSNLPTADRSGSCLLLSSGTGLWMFNCGEGTGRELLRTPWFKHCSVFITSMQMDHIAGLAAYLCSSTPGIPVTIYGPHGLRKYVRTTLRTCFARVPSKYAVHELFESNDLRITNQEPAGEFMHEDELYGDEFVCGGDRLVQVLKDERVRVTAGVLCSRTQSWGYLVKLRGENMDDCTIAMMSSGSETELFTRAAEGAEVLVFDLISSQEAAGTEAGACAKAVAASCLVLTGSPASGSLKLLQAAKMAFNKETVVPALDQMSVTVNFGSERP